MLSCDAVCSCCPSLIYTTDQLREECCQGWLLLLGVG